jgi:hypothetical protein
VRFEGANEHCYSEGYLHLHVYTRYAGKLIEAESTTLVRFRGKERTQYGVETLVGVSVGDVPSLESLTLGFVNFLVLNSVVLPRI